MYNRCPPQGQEPDNGRTSVAGICVPAACPPPAAAAAAFIFLRHPEVKQLACNNSLSLIGVSTQKEPY
jgi:hypothetical protein